MQLLSVIGAGRQGEGHEAWLFVDEIWVKLNIDESDQESYEFRAASCE